MRLASKYFNTQRIWTNKCAFARAEQVSTSAFFWREKDSSKRKISAREQLIEGYEFVLKPIESKTEVYDDLLNDSISHKFLDSLLYVMLPVGKRTDIWNS